MKKDVQEYFIAMQKQYNDMNKMLEKVNKEIEAGMITEEQKANFETYFSTIKANYDRVAYIYHLLNLPPKWIQKIKEKKLLKDQEAFLKAMENATKEAVEAENNEALDNIKAELGSEGDHE